MEKIILDNLVKIKLKELTTTLFNDEYFGFVEDAENYVNTILDFIFTIPTIKHKRTLHTKYGSFYCKYKHNHKTTWYIVFDIEGDTYLIQNITNNHSADYPKFISWLQYRSNICMYSTLHQLVTHNTHSRAPRLVLKQPNQKILQQFNPTRLNFFQ